jgi:hypothetical protein
VGQVRVDLARLRRPDLRKGLPFRRPAPYFLFTLLGEGRAFPRTSSYPARLDRVGPERRKAVAHDHGDEEARVVLSD